MFERITKALKMTIQLAKDPMMLETSFVAEVESELISAGVPKAFAHLLAIEAQLKARIRSGEEMIGNIERGDVPPDQLNAMQLASKELYGSDDTSTLMRKSITRYQEELAKVQRKIEELEKAAQSTNKANEILSRSFPEGALSIMERMENKMEEKERRHYQQILVGKAITDIGTTYDREVHPDPTAVPRTEQVWKDMIILGQTCAILLVVAIFLLVCWNFSLN